MHPRVLQTTSMIWKQLTDDEKSLAVTHAKDRHGLKLTGRLAKLLAPTGTMHKDVAKCIQILAKEEDGPLAALAPFLHT